MSETSRWNGVGSTLSSGSTARIRRLPPSGSLYVERTTPPAFLMASWVSPSEGFSITTSEAVIPLVPAFALRGRFVGGLRLSAINSSLLRLPQLDARDAARHHRAERGDAGGTEEGAVESVRHLGKWQLEQPLNARGFGDHREDHRAEERRARRAAGRARQAGHRGHHAELL